MPARHPPIPRIWLMTDERMGETLWDALDRLPRGSGVVFRHYSLKRAQRVALFRKVAAVARRRHLVLLRGGPAPLGREAGTHGARGRGIQSRAMHSAREATDARRQGADVVFVSPMWPTSSHPGQPGLGRVRLGLLMRGVTMPVIALGGMDAQRFRSLKALNVHGWAAIDAWTGNQAGKSAQRQKRKAVPT